MYFSIVHWWNAKVSNVHDNMELGKHGYMCEHTPEGMEEVVRVEQGYLGGQEVQVAPTDLDRQVVLDVQGVLVVQEVHHVQLVRREHRLDLEGLGDPEVQGGPLVLWVHRVPLVRVNQ